MWHGVIGAILIGLAGYLIKYRSHYWLLSGYLFWDEDARSQVDLKAMSRFVGSVHLAVAVEWLIACMLLNFGFGTAGAAVMTLLYVTVCWGMFRAYEYDGNAKENGRIRSSYLVGTLVVLLILALLLAFIGLKLYN